MFDNESFRRKLYFFYEIESSVVDSISILFVVLKSMKMVSLKVLSSILGSIMGSIWDYNSIFGSICILLIRFWGS